jgi:hypothetical protein
MICLDTGLHFLATASRTGYRIIYFVLFLGSNFGGLIGWIRVFGGHCIFAYICGAFKATYLISHSGGGDYRTMPPDHNL